MTTKRLESGAGPCRWTNSYACLGGVEFVLLCIHSEAQVHADWLRRFAEGRNRVVYGNRAGL